MDYLSFLNQNLKPFSEFEESILENGARLICRMPHKSHLSWCHQIFSPLDEFQILEMENTMKVIIPKEYKEFLMQMNGVKLFGHHFSLYGKRFNYNRTNTVDLYQTYDIVTPNYEERPINFPNDILIIRSYTFDGSKVGIVGRNHKVIRFNLDTFEVYNEWENFETYFTSEIERYCLLFYPNGDEIDQNFQQIPEKTYTFFKIF